MKPRSPHKDLLREGLMRKDPKSLIDFIRFLAHEPDGLGACVHAFALSEVDPTQAIETLDRELACLKAGEREYDWRHRRGPTFESRIERYLNVVESCLLTMHPEVASRQLSMLLASEEEIMGHCFDGENGGCEALARARRLLGQASLEEGHRNSTNAELTPC